MSKAMQTELFNVIKKNIPEEASGFLKQFIEEAQRNEVIAADYKKANERLTEERDSLRDQLVKAQNLINEFKANVLAVKEREDVVEKREKEVTRREIRMEVSDLKVEEAQKRNADLFQITSMVFKNPVYKHRTIENVPIKRTCYTSDYDSNSGNYTHRPSDEVVEHHDKTTDHTQSID